MDRSNLATPHLSGVLHEALTSYISTLATTSSSTTTSHEAGLPRSQDKTQSKNKGKSIETEEDFERRREEEENLAAAELLLGWEGRIAKSVEEWVISGEGDFEYDFDTESAGHYSHLTEEDGDFEDYHRVLALSQSQYQQDEEPYLDILTGKWISPNTSNAAGPSKYNHNTISTTSTDGYEEIGTPSTNPLDLDDNDVIPTLVDDMDHLIDLDCFTPKTEQISREMKTYFQRFMAPTLPPKSRSRSSTRPDQTAAATSDTPPSPKAQSTALVHKVHSQPSSSKAQNAKPPSRQPPVISKSSSQVHQSSNTSAPKPPTRRASTSVSRPPISLQPSGSKSNALSSRRNSSSSKIRSQSQSTGSLKPATTPSIRRSHSPQKPTRRGSMSLSSDERTAQRLQAEWDHEHDLLQRQLRFANDFSGNTSRSRSHSRSPLSQIERDRLEAQRLQAELEAEDARHGSSSRSRHDREKLARLERETADARRLAAEWENEDRARQREAAQVAGLQREWEQNEQARIAALESDMDAAQRAQAQWGDEVRREKEQTKRAAEDESRRRVVADERRGRLEKERAARKEAEKKVRGETERLQRVEVERKTKLEREKKVNEDAAKKIQLQAQRKDKQRVADAKKAKELAEKEKEKKVVKADCASCMEKGEKPKMCVLACKHAYCGECITAAFQNALTSKTQFSCCKNAVPTKTATRFLTPAFIASYDLLILEQSTKNPRYCHVPTCATFIPPASIHGTVAICPKSTCSRRTCAPCGEAEHPGVCKEDAEGKALQEMATREGWKNCPQCNFVIEKNEGCLHMTCKCKYEWCWVCLREWSVCNSTCNRS